MADRHAEFWLREYEAAHGFRPPFEKKDGVILHTLLNHYEDRWAMAYAIRRYHAMNEDPVISQNGWSTPVFRSRYAGSHADYCERRAKDRTGRFKAELAAIAKVPAVAKAVESVVASQGKLRLVR